MGDKKVETRGEGNFYQRNKFVIYILIAVTVAFWATQSLLYYFADSLLNSVITRFVEGQSRGLYTIQFEELRLDMTSRSVELSGLHIVPDKELYWKRVENNEIQTALYRIAVPKLKLTGISSYNLLSNLELHINGIYFDSPTVKLVALPEEKRGESPGMYDVVYKDLYPAMSEYVNQLEVEDVRVTDGYFDLDIDRNPAHKKTQIDNIDFHLDHFLLNEHNKDRKDRLFFSDNLEIKLEGYELALADSIHQVIADEVILSTSDSSIIAHSVSLEPSLIEQDSLPDINTNILNIRVPQIRIEDVNIPRAYFRKNINVGRARLINPEIQSFMQKTRPSKQADTLVMPQNPRINLYKFIKGTINSLALDTFILNYANFAVFNKYGKNMPEISANKLGITLNNFKVDSFAERRKNKIFYSDNLEFELSDYSMYLADSIHRLTAEKLYISSLQSKILAKNVKLRPQKSIKKEKEMTRMFVLVPRLDIQGVNLHSAYNEKNLPIELFRMSYPRVKILHEPDKQDSSPQRFTSDELYRLTSNYLTSISMDNFALYNGSLEYMSGNARKEMFRYSGDVTFRMKNFRLSPKTVFKSQKYFNADHLDLTLDNYYMNIPGNFHNIHLDSLQLSTMDSTLKLSGIEFKADTSGSLLTHLKKYRQASSFDISIPHIVLNEADIRDVYFNDRFDGTSVSIQEPEIAVTNYNRKTDTVQKQPAYDTTGGGYSLFYFDKKRDTANIFTYDSVFRKQVTCKYALEGRDTLINCIDTLKSDKNIPDKANFYLPRAMDGKNMLDTFRIDTGCLKEYAGQDYINAGFDEELITGMMSFMRNVPLKYMELDSVLVNRAHFKYTNKDTSGDTRFSSTQTWNLAINNFRIKPDSLFFNRKLFFSDGYTFDIINPEFRYLKNNTTFGVDTIVFSSEKNRFLAKNILLKTGFQGKNRINIPRIAIDDFNLRDVYQNGDILYDTLHVSGADIQLTKGAYEQNNKDPAKSKKEQSWPDNLASAGFQHILFDSATVNVYDNDILSSPSRFFAESSITLDSLVFNKDTWQNIRDVLQKQSIAFAFDSIYYRLPDNVHRLTAGTVNISTPDSLFSGKDIHITPIARDTIVDGQQLNAGEHPYLLDLKIPSFSADGIDYGKLISDTAFSIQQMRIDTPDIYMDMYPHVKTGGSSPDKILDSSGYAGIIDPLTYFRLDSFMFNGAGVEVSRHYPDSVQKYRVNDMNGKIRWLHIDSAGSEDRLFFTDDITLQIKDFSHKIPGTFYYFDSEEIGLSTLDEELYVKSPELYTKPGRYQVADSMNSDEGVFKLKGDEIIFSGFDFEDLIREHNIRSRKLSGDSLDLIVYKNKRLPHDSNKYKINMHDIFDLEEPGFHLDTILLNDSRVAYEQRSPESSGTGKIVVNNINAVAKDFTNDSAYKAQNKKFRISADMDIENSGNINVFFRYPLGSEENSFYFAGSMDTLDARLFNDIFASMVFVKFRDGKVNKAEFYVNANDSIARGRIGINYNDLKVAFLNKETGTTKGAQVKLTSWLANRIIRNDNPRWKWLPPKQGEVLYKRESSFPFARFWVMSVMSGVKSTFGFDADELQKELKKQKRAAKRKRIFRKDSVKQTQVGTDNIEMIKERLIKENEK